MSEVIGAIKSLAQDFQHLSTKECRQVLGDLLDRVAPQSKAACNRGGHWAEAGDGLSPETCKAVLTFVLSIAAPRCADRRELQWHCLQLVGCVGTAAFLEGADRSDLQTFFCKLAKKEVKSQRMWKPKVMVPMLQYIYRFFKGHALDSEGACYDAMIALMQALFGEMSRSDKWEERWRVKASRCLASVLSLSPKLLEHAVAQMKKEDPSPLLLLAVGTCVKREGADGPHRAGLVELYLKSVVEAKTVFTECVLDAWGSILSLVQPEELEKQLLPVAGRMTKRNPDAIAASFPSLVSHLQVDLASCVKDVLDPMAVELMKVPERRARGRMLIQKAVTKCSSTSAPLVMVDVWLEALKKAAKTDEKQAILLAIVALVGAFSHFGGDQGLCKLADPKGDLVKFATTEANEDSRTFACRALGGVLLQVPTAVSEPVAQELLKQLVDKKASDKVKTAVLECIAEASAKVVEGGPPWLTLAVERLLPFVSLAATKPVYRLQSVLAWAACGSLAAQAKDKVGGALKKEHLALLKDAPSFLNSAPALLKAPAAELVAQAQLWRSLIGGSVAGLAPPFGAKALTEEDNLRLPPCAFSEAPPVCRTALVLLVALHGSATSCGDDRPPQPVDRLGLVAAAKALPEVEATSLIDAMLQALASWVAELATQPAEGRVSSTVLRKALVDLCEVTAAVVPTVCSVRLALIALIAHHPMLSTGAWPAKRLWKWLRTEGPLRKLMKGGAAPWHLLVAVVRNAVKLPVTDKTGFRQAALNLAGSFDMGLNVAQRERDTMMDEISQLVEFCSNTLHNEDMAKEKASSISIFFAPEGRVWTEEGTYVAEAGVDKNIKKNKFLKGLYDDDDDPTFAAEKKVVSRPAMGLGKAAAKGKAKAGAKAASGVGARGGPAGAMTGSEIEAEKMRDQAEIRTRIREYLDEATFALSVVAALARSPANAPILEVALPDLIPKYIVLLGCPLAALESRQSLRTLVNVIVSNTDVARRDVVPEALQVIAKKWMTRGPSAAGTGGTEPVCEVLLDGVSTTSPMPTAALSIVLPVILGLLHNASSLLEDVCKKAVYVLEKQLLVGAKLPPTSVVEVFESLSVALLALPGQRTATQAAMLAAGQFLVASKEDLHQLADMFFSEDDEVRRIVMATLAKVKDNANFLEDRLDPSACRAVLRLGAIDTKVAELAQETLEALELEADEDLLNELVNFTQRPGLGLTMQNLVALATAQVLEELEDPDTTTAALDNLMELFRGHPGQEETPSRPAVARCLEQVFKSCLTDESQVIKAFKFLLRQALPITGSGTPSGIELRDILLAAGVVLIEKHGQEHVDMLLATVEEFEDSAANNAASESARLGTAVFLGALSKHLPAGHPKVPEILPRLVQRLLEPDNTVSVQNAIVKVMPPLMKQDKEQATETLEQLLEIALNASSGEVARRGAAMGLGATVKGLSIQAVGKHEVLAKIDKACHEKSVGVRQGALMCLEGLTLSLGRLFDPYVVTSLPLLLQAFSDPSKPVQAASQQAASAMMSQLSGPAMKQVLKPLLEGIKDKQWKTKLGSIELLASMTACLPKELAKCLPQVVPAICGVVNDQHNKVKEAAREALDRIGSIITSPELKALAPELIEALTDGAQYEHITKRVLDQLLGTSFVHHIDAPSLSLVCPLVARALKERSAEMKRKGAQIVGSMVLLIKDAKDIQPYLPQLLPLLKVTLVDPSPDVRATTAKAFGTLANGLPEDMMGDVLPWLFTMLRSSESNVERSGAAHGLSEVLMAMGTDKIEKLLPDILKNASNKDQPAEVREGYLGLFVYLPVAMGDAFTPYLSNAENRRIDPDLADEENEGGRAVTFDEMVEETEGKSEAQLRDYWADLSLDDQVLETLLGGIADDSQDVRETALRAAQVLVKHFGASHTALLLPPLEDGVFNSDWRIRHASVQLMGQLIEQMLRAHRIPIQNAELMYCEQIPKEWRAHMLASLYIVRSDEHLTVRQITTQVWKACVQNTPRTLKELLPALMKRLIANLASTSREKQRVAARCVGDLVSKLGERVMPELMPIFMNTLSTGNPHVREGVCIGLAELINATTKQMLGDYLGDLIPAIRQAIIDEIEVVRNSASVVVALLHNAVGSRATTDVVTWVIEQLSDEEVEDQGHLFLNGLEQLMAKQPGAVLPIVLNNLTQEPEDGWTVLQIKGLAVISAVPDAHTVHQKLSEVLPVFIKVAGDADSSEDMRKAALESAGRVMDRVEQGGINLLFDELQDAVQDKKDARRRTAGMSLLEHFFTTTSLDVVSILGQVLPAVLPVSLADTDKEALAMGVRTLNCIVKKVKKDELAPYLEQVRNIVLSLVIDPATKKEDPTKLLPGLCEHNGIEPLYPIYQHGLMFGSAEARELAAKGLGELVNHTTEAALKPYVVKITGPLIRIVGDRFPGTVKKAIVDTLKSLLVKGGVTLKPFLPQLQTTYVKCLSDPTEAVRQGAAESLGALVRLSGVRDALLKEQGDGMNNADPAVRHAMCVALGEVLLNVTITATAKLTEERQEKLIELLVPRALGDEWPDAKDREAAAFALAMLLRRHLPVERAVDMLQGDVASGLTDSDGGRRAGATRLLAEACLIKEPTLKKDDVDPTLAETLKKLAQQHLGKLSADADGAVKQAAADLKKNSAGL